MAAFTPGPWRWRSDALINDNDQEVLGGVWCQDGTADIELLNEADAQLITAAPDLYEAAKAMVDWARDPDSDPETQWAILLAIGRQLNLAIMKAEGN